jgi:exodeoxyribonuclease VII large subunit
LNVKIFGDVSIYGPKGQLQLVARGIRLDSGIGLKHLEFEKIKQKLSSEGFFELDRKRTPPKYPNSIGIVTSLDGAALRDVLRIIGSYPAKIILSPANVQGEGAEESIASAIRALRFKVNVVIVCRGGGSAEDLWAFNSEAVARAIFECDAPVISAIGHETDITIADFVADVRAPTPTAAAEMVVPNLGGLRKSIGLLESRIIRALWSSLERRQDKLEYLNNGLSAKRMYAPVIEYGQKLDYLTEHLESAERSIVAALRQDLEVLESRLTSVSPLATLSRGYAIATSSHCKLILEAEDVRLGEILEVLLYKGKLKCMVLEKAVEND